MSTGNRLAAQRSIPISVALAIVLGACADPPTSPGASDSAVRAAPSTDRVSGAALEHPGEAAFEQISQMVPSFAGYYLEGENLVVLVTDPTASRSAEAAVRQVFPATLPAKATGRLAQAPVVGRRAQYTFIQLRDWRDQIEAGVFLSLDDAASIGVDEISNRVVIGLATGSGRGELEQWLTRSAIPAGAVKIQVTGRAVPYANLTDFVRPVMGGLSDTVSFQPTIIPWCTFAFNAQYQGANVVVTASHCTSTLYGPDAGTTLFYQNLITSGDLVGNESYDPPGFYKTGAYGRYSDAAMITYQAGVSFQLGSIARPLSHGNGWGVVGSSVINSSNPQFTITGTISYPTAGMSVDKVGYKTGWTRGQVTDVCMDERGSDGAWRFCSYRATYYSDHGDSGAPVFIDPDDANSVNLVGINWGGNPTAGKASFSPFGGILKDFPNGIITFPPPPPPFSASISGPQYITRYQSAQYTETSSGGTAPFTYQWRTRQGPNQSNLGPWSTWYSTGSTNYTYLSVNSCNITVSELEGLVTDATSRTADAVEYVYVSNPC
jgi:hypothetical protein